MKLRSLKYLTLTLSFIVASAATLSAQSLLPAPGSSCSCETTGHCKANQTCPDGYFAICTCSATGCTSSCSAMAGFMDLSVASLTKKLRLASPADYGPVLSKAFKKVVSFKTSDPKFRFDRAVADGAAGSHWDIVAYLAKNGELTINGHDLAFWTGIRQNLLSGGGFDLCAGPVPAKVIVDELSFISGTRYSIISGDPKTMVSGPFTGDTISELINTLDQKANITIAEK